MIVDTQKKFEVIRGGVDTEKKIKHLKLVTNNDPVARAEARRRKSIIEETLDAFLGKDRKKLSWYKRDE